MCELILQAYVGLGMGDGTEFDDEDVDDAEGLLENADARPLMYATLADARGQAATGPPDAIWDLVDEIFNPDLVRSHVITMHLYVEYWLDKLLNALQLEKHWRFSRKVKQLDQAGALDPVTHHNIVLLNDIRNCYAHTRDLKKAAAAVGPMLALLKRDPSFEATDRDPLRVICFQTMFALDATLSSGGKPPRLEPYPHEKVRAKLLEDGELHWQQCELLDARERGYIVDYTLRCPLCIEGKIEREKDNTPGFKESTIWGCKRCGLGGDSTTLLLKTAKPEYREPKSPANAR